MKKVSVFTVLGCLVLLLVGCVPSLHPFYTSKDLVYEPLLEGTWSDGEKATWIYEKSQDSSYTVTYIDDTTPGIFDCHLFKIGNQTYIDFYPRELPTSIKDQLNDFYKFHLLPIHTLAKLTFKKDSIDMAMMDMDFLKELSQKNKLNTKYEKIEDAIVFTASSKELQKFIKANPRSLFAKPGTLTRTK